MTLFWKYDFIAIWLWLYSHTNVFFHNLMILFLQSFLKYYDFILIITTLFS